DWVERGLGDRVPLTVVECADRRLVHAATELAYDTVIDDRAEVTVLLPRRTFSRLSQRLLHDRTADRIAESVGRIPHVAATIVPFDTTLPHEAIERIEARQQMAAELPALGATLSVDEAVALPPRPDGTVPICAVRWKDRVSVEGRVKLVQP